MRGMVVLGSLAVFLLAVAGIVFFSVQAIGWLGKALNPRRPRPSRLRAGAVSAAAALAVVGSGAGGFLGITTLWYAAQVNAPGAGAAIPDSAPHAAPAEAQP